MIRFENVKKIYPGQITALNDVTFDVDKGEFSFIVGPSGAGKSTLIRLLVRQELPTNGNIFFEDVEVPSIPTQLLPVYRQQLGIVFQDLKLIQGKTVAENIQFALEISGKHKNEVFETSQYLLDIVNLTGRSHLFPNELSGGEKQRVAIARALASDPKVFIADEPTGNLDDKTAMEILNILKAINQTGTTVLVITHDKDIVEKMKTRVIEMDDGKIVKDDKKPKSNVARKSFFDGLDEDISKILKEKKIFSIDDILDKSEDDLSKFGLKENQIEQLNKHIQSYLSQK